MRELDEITFVTHSMTTRVSRVNSVSGTLVTIMVTNVVTMVITALNICGTP